MSVTDNGSAPEPVDPPSSPGPPDRPRSTRAPLFVALLAVVIVLVVGSLAYMTVGPGHSSRHCSGVQVATGRC